MNDASSSSDHPRLDLDSQDELESAAAPTSDDDAGIAQQRKRAQQEQKAAFLDHLIRNVDIMIYAQLSVLYYMEYVPPQATVFWEYCILTPSCAYSCSFPKFILRALPQWFYFTPKSPIFPPPPLAHRPYIRVIFGPNILFALLHLLLPPPAAGEATRGYLHGGLLIDFVGQKSPVSRWRLVALDILVLMLQILMLGITLERTSVKRGDEAVVVVVPEAATEPQQDHDLEERGILRQDLGYTEDIELRDMHHASSDRTGGDEDRERDELLIGADVGAEQHPLDSYYTGEQVIANMHVWNTIRAQWQATGVAAGESGGSAASGVQVAAVAAATGRTFTFRLGEEMQRNS